jgi:beta-lactamase regulating signal transducer with metallopeptidase domain
MTDFGVTLMWCSCQVAIVGALAGVAHYLLRNCGRSIVPIVFLTTFVIAIWFAGAALGPWPSYLDQIDSSQIAELLNPNPEADASSLAPSDQLPVSTIIVDTIRTAMLELAPAQSRSLMARWPWAQVISMLFVLGFAIGCLQLTIGLVVVRARLRRSHPLRDRNLVRMVEQLREKMNCRRSVELRVSYDLSTAATVGWLEPVILLPADWRRWTQQERRAVLAHEMAHIVHNDYLAVLLSQVGLALHFYHPVVHWLSSRMRLEQEFAADAVAAEHAGGQREYLRTLAHMALRQSTESSLGLARAFLSERSMFVERMKMLRDKRRKSQPLSAGKQALLVVSLLLFGLMVSGVRGPNSGRIWAAALAQSPAARETNHEPTIPRIGTRFGAKNQITAPNERCPS